MMIRAVLLLSLATQTVEYVVPKECIQSISMAKDFECAGPDREHLTCKGIVLVYKESCTQFRIKQ